MRTMTLLNEMGDLTITWDEDKDAEMEVIIQKKLDQGIRFFQIETFSKKQIQVQKLDEVRGRVLNIPDEDIERLFTDGKIGIIKRIVGSVVDTIGTVTSVKDIVSTDTVGVKQLVGG